MRRRPGLVAILLVLPLGGCARTDLLHGRISTLKPSVCVAAEGADGRCFTPGNGTDLFRGYRVGDCVYLRYRPADGDGHTGDGPDLVATEVKPAPCEDV